jgi:hypothetical protein
MLRKAASKVLWLGRATSTILGLAVILAMMAASTLPAFAAGWDSATGCKEGDELHATSIDDPVDKNRDLTVCVDSSGRTYDNRLADQSGGSGGGWDPDTGCKVGDDLIHYVLPGESTEADKDGDLAYCASLDGSAYDNHSNKVIL